MRGIGTGGGFKMMVEDRTGRGLQALEAATQEIVGRANQTPGLAGVFSLFNTRTPKIYADIDRVRAEMLGVPASRVFEALEVYLGSAYVNDFNYLGRTFRVTAQADGAFRQDLRDIGNFKTRSDSGGMVPLSAVASFRDLTGPYRVRALQPLSGRRGAGRDAARLLDRHGARRDGADRRRRRCRRASASNGPSSRCRRSSPAIPAS